MFFLSFFDIWINLIWNITSFGRCVRAYDFHAKCSAFGFVAKFNHYYFLWQSSEELTTLYSSEAYTHSIFLGTLTHRFASPKCLLNKFQADIPQTTHQNNIETHCLSLRWLLVICRQNCYRFWRAAYAECTKYIRIYLHFGFTKSIVIIMDCVVQPVLHAWRIHCCQAHGYANEENIGGIGNEP